MQAKQTTGKPDSPVYAVLEKPSMIDFPGSLCGVFFLSGCNFSCGFCHNATLMGTKQAGLTWERLDEICKKFKADWVDAVCITGGEPTLSADLVKLIRFSLDDPMPDPEIKESITEVSEPTNKTVEADPDESAYYEQEAKLRTIERKDVEPDVPEAKESAEKKHKERVEKLRQMSIKLRSPGGLNELEDEPAYRRKNVELSDEKPSEESQVSRYTLSDEDEGSTLKDNPFLHDNVD